MTMRKILLATVLLIATSMSSYRLAVSKTNQNITNDICGSAAARMMVYGYSKNYDSKTDEIAVACGYVRQMTHKEYRDN